MVSELPPLWYSEDFGPDDPRDEFGMPLCLWQPCPDAEGSLLVPPLPTWFASDKFGYTVADFLCYVECLDPVPMCWTAGERVVYAGQALICRYRDAYIVVDGEYDGHLVWQSFLGASAYTARVVGRFADAGDAIATGLSSFPNAALGILRFGEWFNASTGAWELDAVSRLEHLPEHRSGFCVCRLGDVYLLGIVTPSWWEGSVHEVSVEFELVGRFDDDTEALRVSESAVQSHGLTGHQARLLRAEISKRATGFAPSVFENHIDTGEDGRSPLAAGVCTRQDAGHCVPWNSHVDSISDPMATELTLTRGGNGWIECVNVEGEPIGFALHDAGLLEEAIWDVSTVRWSGRHAVLRIRNYSFHPKLFAGHLSDSDADEVVNRLLRACHHRVR